jgi:hypothetical protein
LKPSITLINEQKIVGQQAIIGMHSTKKKRITFNDDKKLTGIKSNDSQKTMDYLDRVESEMRIPSKFH